MSLQDLQQRHCMHQNYPRPGIFPTKGPSFRLSNFIMPRTLPEQQSRLWHPYNFQSARTHIETILNYQFIHPHLLEEALHASGPVYINGNFVEEGNKKLTMIGDSVLDLALAITEYQAGFSRGRRQLAVTLFVWQSNLADLIIIGGISNRRSSTASY